MPVALSAMRPILMRGLNLAQYDEFPLSLAKIPKQFKHVRNIMAACGIKTYGDLSKLPADITGADGTAYASTLTYIGREYSQWTPRIRGPEPVAGPDGKIEVYQDIRNDARVALDDEISDGFSDWILTQRAPESEWMKTMSKNWDDVFGKEKTHGRG